AILVLFLFVIMLLNLRGEKFGDKKPALNRISKMTLVTFFFLEFMIIIKQMTFPQSIDNSIAPAAADFGSVKPVAELLYIKYIYPFELTSILLLVAIIGAVVMAKKGKEDNGEED
ncbi:MAG: NADH-quinone oxidoreductase subunit J, partial [candidate division Zixibacteria bacterium]|nr:NADH-quinone oxidoreductase subunit J [candidate division Zixibacteria bacterium]